MDVYRKRSTTSVPAALSISYLMGSPPIGTSMTTLTSWGGFRPTGMASRRMSGSFEGIGALPPAPSNVGTARSFWPGSRASRSGRRPPAALPSFVELARLLGQHDRDAVADRISELRRAADQLLALAVVFEHGLGDRADQDFKKLRVDARGPRPL